MFLKSKDSLGFFTGFQQSKFEMAQQVKLGNRYPGEASLLHIANHLNISFFTLSIQHIANIFRVPRMLFDTEWTYELRPTMKNGDAVLKYEDRLPSARPRPQEDEDAFKKMIKY